MNFTLTEVKSLLADTIGKDLLKEGFTFNKSKFEFAKKLESSKIRCLFFFYNYTPHKIEYKFSFNSVIKEIEVEEKKYCSFLNQPFERRNKLLFREGDFHPKVKHESMKFRAAFTHILINHPQDSEVIEESRKVLRNEFLPRMSIFSTLEGFQGFILSNFQYVIDFQLLLPSLLALKLKGDEAFTNLIDFLKFHLEYKNMDPRNIIKQVLDNVTAFKEKDTFHIQK